ncbi:hypothetical protein [Mycetocola zhujimingii]|uniref:hypothetical protein n=1 Tax=Mycetocola zhujimingii TaxID=2079792 RepID=UPI0013C4FD66|nr:hypothetical protein [Mycetocola zhujimingii]
MYEPRPADIALPPTASIGLNHLFPVDVQAAIPATEASTSGSEPHDAHLATVPITTAPPPS